jgi:hypothetical protein
VREQAFAARELNGDPPISVQEFYGGSKIGSKLPGKRYAEVAVSFRV